MTFRPIPCRSRWEGLIVCLWIILIDLLFFVWTIRRPVDWIKFALLFLIFASLPILAHLAYRTWAAFSLEYWLDRNAVTISWANRSLVLPMDQVQRIIQGGLHDLGQGSWRSWPAPEIRIGRALGLLDLQVYATRPLSECLVLDTGDQFVAISPAKEAEFLAALQERYRLGPVANVQFGQVRSSFWDRRVAANPLGLALVGAGFVGCLILFGVLMVRFPDLPEVLAFHYNSDGLPDVIREKSALFLLPGIGLVAWLLNGLWGTWMAMRGQHTGAYMLWGGAIIVQLCSLMALSSLIS